MKLEPVLTFDIETIPDVEGGRRLYGLPGNDAEVAAAMVEKRQLERGSDFLPHHQHRVAAISCALRSSEGFKLWSLGKPEEDEASLIRRFYEGIERYKPTLVSWNGSGFDMPVLHYRSLVHGIPAPVYWDTGKLDRDFKWNSYLGRYHERHTDLMDVLSGYQPRANAPLDEIAVLLGQPGKMGMHGSLVWEAWQAGRIQDIRNYCETDVLNTYLVYLRFQLLRGALDMNAYGAEQALVRKSLQDAHLPHLEAFLQNWPAPAV